MPPTPTQNRHPCRVMRLNAFDQLQVPAIQYIRTNKQKMTESAGSCAALAFFWLALLADQPYGESRCCLTSPIVFFSEQGDVCFLWVALGCSSTYGSRVTFQKKKYNCPARVSYSTDTCIAERPLRFTVIVHCCGTLRMPCCAATVQSRLS